MNILILTNCLIFSWCLKVELLNRNYHIITITDDSLLEHISIESIDQFFLYYPRFGRDELEVILYIRKKCQAPIQIISKYYDIDKKDILNQKDITINLDPMSLILNNFSPDKSNYIDSTSTSHFRLDSSRRAVIINGREIELSHREFDVLQFLYNFKGEIVETERLINSIWGGFCSEANVYVTIQKLREKVEDNPRNPKLIVSKIGGGYSLII